MRILIAEDERELNNIITKSFLQTSYKTESDASYKVESAVIRSFFIRHKSKTSSIPLLQRSPD